VSVSGFHRSDLAGPRFETRISLFACRFRGPRLLQRQFACDVCAVLLCRVSVRRVRVCPKSCPAVSEIVSDVSGIVSGVPGFAVSHAASSRVSRGLGAMSPLIQV
jgi:hypothetical protein